MSSTNKTSNLELSQFLGSDSPKWLTDYNADMQKIDTAVGAVQSQADATDLVVAGHSTAIESLQSTEGEQGIAIANLRTDVNHNSGDISTINSLIGNGEPTTTDKTLIGAINELNANAGQYQMVTHGTVSIEANGTETVADLIKRVYDAINNIKAGLASNESMVITGGNIFNRQLNCAIAGVFLTSTGALGTLVFYGLNSDASANTYMSSAHLTTDAASNFINVVTIAADDTISQTHIASETASGTYSIRYQIYKDIAS